MYNFVLIFIGLIFTYNSVSTDNRRIIDPKIVPVSGVSAKDFAPKGWKVEQEIAGDLNTDGIADLVIQLIEDKPEQDFKGEYQDRFRALVIALKNSAGKFERVAVGGKLLQCTSCGGMLGSGGVGAELKIEKGGLVISQLSGSRWATDHTYRFRWDAAKQKFLLIGEDLNTSDRATGESETTSTNFITGKQIKEKSKYNKKTDKDVSVSKQVKVVGKKSIGIEEVDYEH